MKTFKILSLIFLFGLFASCEKDDVLKETTNGQVKASQPDIIEQIALAHNEGLEFIYNELESKINDGSLDKSDRLQVCNFVYAKGIEFFQGHPLVYDYNASVQAADEAYYYNYNYHPFYSFESKMWTPLDDFDGTVSELEKIYLKNLEKRIYRARNYNNVIEQYNIIKSQVISESRFTDDQKLTMLVAIEIGIKSTEYWNENYKAWNDLVGFDITKEITILDIIDAVLADLRWARRLAIFGPGPALRGALLASGISILMDIIED